MTESTSAKIVDQVIQQVLLLRTIQFFQFENKHLPSILEMLELCISGQAFRIFLRSSLAQTMKAFIGRLICGLPSGSRRLWRMILAP